MATLGTAPTLPRDGYGVPFLVLGGFVELLGTCILVLDGITVIGMGLEETVVAGRRRVGMNKWSGIRVGGWHGRILGGGYGWRIGW